MAQERLFVLGATGRMGEELAEYVADTRPDILCLQEVVHSPGSEKDWLIYRDGEHELLQRANFYRDVCQALPEHVGIFCPAAQGALWDNDASIPSQWGIATFVHMSLPIIGQAQGFVHKTYSPYDYGEHPRSRNAHGVRVYDYGRHRALSVAHMHGLRDLRGKMDTPERTVQAHRLLDLSKRVSEPGDLTVVCGDFNIEPDSETIRILNDAGLVELVTGRGFSSTRTSHYKKPGRFADYLLVNDETAVRDFQVVQNPEVSDHCPLIVEL